MKEIQDYLAQIYLKAGITITIDEDEAEINADFSSNTIEKIVNFLIELRNTDYQKYLSCLSILIFYNYADLNADASFIKTSLEESIIKNNEKDQTIKDREKLIDYIVECKNIEDFDTTLAKNNDLDLLYIFFEYHITATFESSFEELCYIIMMDIESMPLYCKYVKPEIIEETFQSAISYTIEHDPHEVLSTVESFYILSESIESSYELHKYIINRFLKNNYTEQLSVYVKDILWCAYIRCKYQEDDESITEEMEDFIHNYETNPEFRHKEYFNIILKPDTSTTLKLYLEFNDIDCPTNKELDSKKLNALSQKMEIETTEFVRKLIPKKKKSE